MAQSGKQAQSSQGRALEFLDLSSHSDDRMQKSMREIGPDGSLCSISALLWTLNATGLSTVDAETLGAFLYSLGQIDSDRVLNITRTEQILRISGLRFREREIENALVGLQRLENGWLISGTLSCLMCGSSTRLVVTVGGITCDRQRHVFSDLTSLDSDDGLMPDEESACSMDNREFNWTDAITESLVGVHSCVSDMN
ncbi:uncharacterized protein EAF02_008781 [Botrytis sinoallii]|uniref:uncharacterized protein n=1 Tax=Botrytis sinoallii TaxID=1463999 RepID=UPI0018FF681E|nr:uncharacterized protein EAF02_008781 [Botrytis sinoallii]KAF7872710.1 hypothetical protein EAF02_008781 [Botrytis sinoallii]